MGCVIPTRHQVHCRHVRLLRFFKVDMLCELSLPGIRVLSGASWRRCPVDGGELLVAELQREGA